MFVRNVHVSDKNIALKVTVNEKLMRGGNGPRNCLAV